MMALLLRCRSGATSIEYAVIAMLIALVLIASIVSIGDSLTAFFMDVSAGFGAGQQEG